MSQQMKQRFITISFIAFSLFAFEIVKAIEDSDAIEVKQDIEQSVIPQEVNPRDDIEQTLSPEIIDKKIVDETNNLITITPTGFTFLLKSGIQNIKTLAALSIQMATHPIDTAINVSCSVGGKAQEITKSGLKNGYYAVRHPLEIPKRIISIVRHPIQEAQNLLSFFDNIDLNGVPVLGRIDEAMSQFSGLIRVTPENCPTLYNMLAEVEQELGVEVKEVYVYKGNFLSNLLESLGTGDISCNAFQKGITSKTSFIALGKDLILGVNHGSKSFVPGLSPEQIKAIFAHELGHHKHRHVLKLALTKAISAPLLLLIQYLIFSKSIIPGGNDMFRVNLCGKDLLWTSANILIYRFFNEYAIPLLLNAYSRKCEKEADMQACCSLDKQAALAEALAKMFVLYETKHRALSQLFQSHPDLGERLDYLHQLPMAELTR